MYVVACSSFCKGEKETPLKHVGEMTENCFKPMKARRYLKAKQPEWSDQVVYP